MTRSQGFSTLVHLHSILFLMILLLHYASYFTTAKTSGILFDESELNSFIAGQLVILRKIGMCFYSECGGCNSTHKNLDTIINIADTSLNFGIIVSEYLF